MAVVALDTHQVVKELREVGFTEAQAEAVTRAVRRAGDLDLSSLATKADLANFATKADLASLVTRSEFDTKLAALATKEFVTQQIAPLATKAELGEIRTDILKWIIGAIGFQTVAVIGAIAALIRILAPG